MGDYERTRSIAEGIDRIVKSSRGPAEVLWDIAKHIHNREKALNKIIGVLLKEVRGKRFTRDVEVIESIDEAVITGVISMRALSEVDPHSIEVKGDGTGGYVLVESRRYI